MTTYYIYQVVTYLVVYNLFITHLLSFDFSLSCSFWKAIYYGLKKNCSQLIFDYFESNDFQDVSYRI